MTNNKVGILTFHNYDNYGAILQSYALEKKLEEYGAEVEIIDYRCEYISNPFRLVNLRKKGLFNYLYGVIGNICYMPRRKKCRQFRGNMKYSQPVTRGHMEAVSGKYDRYIAGSDQVWSYKLTNFDQTYFLDFVEKGKKKCSYAASMGEGIPPAQYREAYARLLSDFDKILVRESYGADVVSQLTGKRPRCACDPTMLLTREEWEKLLVRPKRKGGYIAVYQLGIDRNLVKFVSHLQKVTGLKVEYIPFPLVGLLNCRLNLTVGPAEWMGLIRDAQYVVSDSFHGIVFALLFQKKFFAKTNGHHKNRRIEQILKRVKLEDRTLDRIREEQLTKEIDYTYVNQQMKEMREESLELLHGLFQEQADD